MPATHISRHGLYSCTLLICVAVPQHFLQLFNIDIYMPHAAHSESNASSRLCVLARQVKFARFSAAIRISNIISRYHVRNLTYHHPPVLCQLPLSTQKGAKCVLNNWQSWFGHDLEETWGTKQQNTSPCGFRKKNATNASVWTRAPCPATGEDEPPTKVVTQPLVAIAFRQILELHIIYTTSLNISHYFEKIHSSVPRT